MDLLKMIAELQAERQCLDEAIEALERLSSGNARRRGRVPQWTKEEPVRQSVGSERPDEDNSAAKSQKA